MANHIVAAHMEWEILLWLPLEIKSAVHPMLLGLGRLEY